MLGLDVGEVESGSFWVEFLRGSKRRGLSGVKLCVSDQHEGLKQGVARVLGVPWRRWTVHFTCDLQPTSAGIKVGSSPQRRRRRRRCVSCLRLLRRT